MVIAHLFRRSGREALSENEFANAASLDLHWFAPKDARTLVAGLVRSGHLEREADGRLRPVFDITKVDVPLTFRPPPDLHTKVPPAGSAAPRHAGRAAAPRSGPPAAPANAPRAVPSPAPEATPRAAPPPAPSAASSRAAPVEGGASTTPTTVQELLEALSGKSGEPVPVWVERMNRTVQECGDLMAPEAALLVAAAREGVAVADWARPVQDALTTRRAKRTR